MSDFPNPPPAGEAPPPMVIPVRYGTPPPQPAARPAPAGSSVFGSLARAFLSVVLAISLGINLLLFGLIYLGASASDGSSLHEKLVRGDAKTFDKVAVITVDGVIMEGQMGFVHKQIAAAAADDHVKAVVLRINSPGGSITASDDLYRRLKELADGSHPKQSPGPKPVVVSMGAVAASGGYYIAMPAQYVYAERTSITGSIGVYAAFPNIKGLSEKYGFGMNVIKAGAVKDSGSMFHDMTAQERYLWQGMVDNAYRQFIDVVEAGRPALQGKMTEPVAPPTKIPDRGPDGKIITKDGDEVMVDFVRQRADGGIYTAQDALKYGLIDAVGVLDDASKKTASLGQLAEGTYKVIQYERPAGLANLLLGARNDGPDEKLDAGKLAAGAVPRLWYLTPQSELSGFLSAMGAK